MTPKDREQLEKDLRLLLENLKKLKSELQALNDSLEPPFLPLPPVDKKLN